MQTIANWCRLRGALTMGAAAGVLGVSAPAASALPGPPLHEPAIALAASWGCEGTFTPAGPAPVLLVHGAIGTAGQWESNYELVLRRAGHAVCTVSVPGRALLDAQRSVEYVVAAMRGTAALAERPIVVIGHSMGAELVTYALRFWPDLAGAVQDFVGLAGVYEHGTAAAPTLCMVACPVAARQITPGSRFLRALAARPVYAGPGYTTISTQFDELVVPQPQAGELTGVRNIVLQDVCPGRVADHVSVIDDAVAYALVQDAVAHEGGAEPARAGLPCGATTIPGSNTAALAEEVARFTMGFGPFVTDGGPEPPLRCYLDPACPKPRLRPAIRFGSVRVRGSRVHHVTGTLVLPEGAVDRCAGTVTVRFTRGRRVVGRGEAGVQPDCRFGARVRLAAGADRGRLRRVVRFAGNRELLAVRRAG